MFSTSDIIIKQERSGIAGFQWLQTRQPLSHPITLHTTLTLSLLQVGAEHQTWSSRERFSNRNDAEQHASCAALHGLAGITVAEAATINLLTSTSHYRQLAVGPYYS